MNMEQASLFMMQRVRAAEVGDQRRIGAEVLGPVATRSRNWVDPDWVSAGEAGLVSVAFAADERVTDAQFGLRSKQQLHDVLRDLGVLDGGENQ